MTKQRGRPASFQRKILATLLAHHQAGGWDMSIARGELLARLHGWNYGQHMAERHDEWGDAIPVFYTGIDRASVSKADYQKAQTVLSRALWELFRRGLVRLGSAWEPRAISAAEFTRELEQDLADPAAAYARYLTIASLLPGTIETCEAYIARRRAILAGWQAGRGRLPFSIQTVALTEQGREAANNVQPIEAGSVEQKSDSAGHPTEDGDFC
jgi:hypothetical protein